jgi:hypothetical protein
MPFGQVGYLGFAPALSCVDGTLSGCNGTNVGDGTAVSACAPIMSGGMPTNGTLVSFAA